MQREKILRDLTLFAAFAIQARSQAEGLLRDSIAAKTAQSAVKLQFNSEAPVGFRTLLIALITNAAFESWN